MELRSDIEVDPHSTKQTKPTIGSSRGDCKYRFVIRYMASLKVSACHEKEIKVAMPTPGVFL